MWKKRNMYYFSYRSLLMNWKNCIFFLATGASKDGCMEIQLIFRASSTCRTGLSRKDTGSPQWHSKTINSFYIYKILFVLDLPVSHKKNFNHFAEKNPILDKNIFFFTFFCFLFLTDSKVNTSIPTMYIFCSVRLVYV